MTRLGPSTSIARPAIIMNIEAMMTSMPKTYAANPEKAVAAVGVRSRPCDKRFFATRVCPLGRPEGFLTLAMA